MASPRFYALWAINGPLDARLLCQQLDAMRTFGFDGAVFAPRFYPGPMDDAYTAAVDKLAAYAKSIDMELLVGEHGRSMVDCVAGGWGATPDEFRKRLLDAIKNGDDVLVHQWQYQFDSHAACQWPASTPNHIGWSAAFAQLLRQVKREPGGGGETSAGVVDSPVVPVEWRVTDALENALPRSVTVDSPGHYRANFYRGAGIDVVSLHFLEMVTNVAVNGNPLTVAAEWDDFRAVVPVTAMIVGENEVTFEHSVLVDGQPVQPMAWVFGRFAVVGPTAWTPGPNGTLRCSPPLTLLPPPLAIERDLTAGGYPYAAAPVNAIATIEIPANATTLKLIDIAADAARVRLGKVDCGFTWGPDWTMPLPASLPPGPHEATITIYPSAFNRYGPHHHADGDPGAATPDAVTIVPEWHVKALRLPSGVIFG